MDLVFVVLGLGVGSIMESELSNNSLCRGVVRSLTFDASRIGETEGVESSSVDGANTGETGGVLSTSDVSNTGEIGGVASSSSLSS